MKVAQAPMVRVAELRPLGPLATPSGLGQVHRGQLIELPPDDARDGGLTFDRVVKAGAVTSGAAGTAGLILLTTDKVAAMPLADLTSQLKGTPVFRVSDHSAASSADALKKLASSSLGQYLVVGLSGGILAVGVAYALDPKASWRKIMTVFVVAALACVAIAVALSQYGILVPTHPARP